MDNFTEGLSTVSVGQLFGDGFSSGDNKGDKPGEGEGNGNGNGGGQGGNILGTDADGNLLPDNSGDKGGDAPGSGDGTGGGEGGQAQGGTSSPTGVTARVFLDRLSEKGFIGDVSSLEIKIGDDTVDLSKIDSLDDIVDILGGVIKSQNEDVLTGKIDSSSMSEFMLKMIEVDKAGGNVASLLEAYQKIQAPIDNIDMSSRDGQLSLIRKYYKMLNMDEESISDNMELIESKGDDFIESRALKFETIIKDKMKSLMENERKRAEDTKVKVLEDMKKYKKNIKSSLFSSFQINDRTISKAIDFVTKPIDNSNHTAIDMAYMNTIKDPDKASDLIMFLMDKDEFIKQKTESVKRGINKKVIQVLGSSKKALSTSSADGTGNDDDEDGVINVGSNFTNRI